MQEMKISFIATVYNEETAVGKLLDSLLQQSRLPDEVIITDGGSSDKTVEHLKTYLDKFISKKMASRFFIKKGNRSVGRNAAVSYATGDIIVCTDAGCILDKNWIENIIKSFTDKGVDVVAGYYKGKANSVFQKCLIPYVLVMPDKVNANTFLPASRSMAFTKSIWEKVGGFPEAYSHNEDYVFAKKLKRAGAKIAFQKDAIVYWLPRNSLKEAYTMFYRFAYGDAEAHIYRPKVILILLRYLLFFILFLLFVFTQKFILLIVLLLLFLLYSVWAISKNYRYVRNPQAFLYLPLLQLTSDIAVLGGTIRGSL